MTHAPFAPWAWRRAAAALLAAVLALAALPAPAQAPPSPPRLASDLQGVRRVVRKLRTELADTRERLSSAEAQVRTSVALATGVEQRLQRLELAFLALAALVLVALLVAGLLGSAVRSRRGDESLALAGRQWSRFRERLGETEERLQALERDSAGPNPYT